MSKQRLSRLTQIIGYRLTKTRKHCKNIQLKENLYYHIYSHKSIGNIIDTIHHYSKSIKFNKYDEKIVALAIANYDTFDKIIIITTDTAIIKTIDLLVLQTINKKRYRQEKSEQSVQKR